jgi:hypothetical protein
MSGPEPTSDDAGIGTAVLVALGVVCLGVAILVGSGYVHASADTQGDYTALQGACESLDGEATLVDGGLGLRPLELNGSHVRACQNTSYEQYDAQRTASMRLAPFNLGQWALYGGAGTGISLGGLALLRRERRFG